MYSNIYIELVYDIIVVCEYLYIFGWDCRGVY